MRKRPKVDASISDSALSQTRRSDASEKRRKILASTFGRFRLWISFDSWPESFKISLSKIIYQKLNKNFVLQLDI